MSAEGLRDAALAWHGRGAKLARRAARFVRDGVDSAMETRLRMLLVLAGLPAPEVNFILHHPDRELVDALRHVLPGTQADHRARRTATCRGQSAMASLNLGLRVGAQHHRLLRVTADSKRTLYELAARRAESTADRLQGYLLRRSAQVVVAEIHV